MTREGSAISDASPPGPAGLRASDADRDRVADTLAQAMAEGRLSAEEHGARLDAAYAARTRALPPPGRSSAGRGPPRGDAR